MRNVSITLWLLLLFQLFLLIGAVLLQRYLSKRESRWPGLVLPGMTSLYALAMALSATVSDGGFPGDRPWPPSCCATSPPWILLTIYALCREKLRKRNELEKMNIHDL